jgi:hypothetical protein
MNDSVVVPGIEDPIFPLSEYADLAAAMNAALDAMGEFRGKAMYLPYGGPYEVSSGKVTVPIFGPDQKYTWDGAPTIVGGGPRQASAIRVTEAFPDDVLIESTLGDREGDAKPANNKALRIEGLKVNDPDGALGDAVMSLPDRVQLSLENLSLRSTAADHLLEIPHPGSGDFIAMHTIEFNFSAEEQTALAIAGNQVLATDLRFNGSSEPIPGTVGAFIGGGAVVLQGDFEGIETGVILGGSGPLPERGSAPPDAYAAVDSNGGEGEGARLGAVTALYQRTENPGVGVPTPIDIRGYDSAVVVPMNAPQRTVRHSRDGGCNTTWIVGGREPRHFGGGGPSLPGWLRGGSGVEPAPGRIELPADGSRLDNGGVPVAGGRLPPEATAPQFRTEIRPPRGDDGGPVGRTRIGFVENRWSDWVGAVIDETTGAYQLTAVQDGSPVGAVDTGVRPIGEREVLKVTLGAGQATVAIQTTGTAGGKAWHTFELPAPFGPVQTTYAVEDASADATLDVYDGTLETGSVPRTIDVN